MEPFQLAYHVLTASEPVERIAGHPPSHENVSVLEPQIKMFAAIVMVAVQDEPFHFG
jgi:hypothetical protein